jgi:hypothetical protein
VGQHTFGGGYVGRLGFLHLCHSRTTRRGSRHILHNSCSTSARGRACLRSFTPRSPAPTLSAPLPSHPRDAKRMDAFHHPLQGGRHLNSGEPPGLVTASGRQPRASATFSRARAGATGRSRRPTLRNSRASSRRSCSVTQSPICADCHPSTAHCWKRQGTPQGTPRLSASAGSLACWPAAKDATRQWRFCWS